MGRIQSSGSEGEEKEAEIDFFPACGGEKFDFSWVDCYLTGLLKPRMRKKVFFKSQRRCSTCVHPGIFAVACTLPVIIQTTVGVLSTRTQMACRVKGLRDHHTAMLVVWAIVIRSFQGKAGQELLTIWLASLHLIAAGSRPRGRAKKRHSNKRMKGTEADHFRSGKESDCFFKGVKLEQGENP